MASLLASASDVLADTLTKRWDPLAQPRPVGRRDELERTDVLGRRLASQDLDLDVAQTAEDLVHLGPEVGLQRDRGPRETVSLNQTSA